jgi:dipeptidyl aminopeptidase/acylaminoacyl peptidase
MKYNSGKRRPNLFRKPRRRASLPISLVILAIIIGLLALIQPLQYFENPIDVNKIKVPTVTPSATPLPLPTDVHGGHIVFTCTRNNVNQICIINADGSNYKQLTNNSTNTYYPAISPTSRTIVYAVNQYDYFDLYSMDLIDSKTTQLTSDIGNLFSPDFSSDGKQILFVNKTLDGKSELWVMGNAGENPHAIYTGVNAIVGAAWSHDGSQIAFAMSVQNTFSYQVFVLNAHQPSQPPRQITQSAQDIGGSLAWSPDGSNILVYAGPVAAREIYRVDVATGAMTQLTLGGNNAAAAYSPDGQYIVYNSLRNNDQADLYIMRADGHSTRQLTSFPEPDWQPQWGP